MSAQQSTPRDEPAEVTPQSAPSRGTDAVARTVYLQAPGRAPEPGSLMVRLAGVYVTSFALTSVLVLGTWLWARGQRVPPTPPAPEIRIVEVEKQVPVPIPVPVLVPAPAPVVEPVVVRPGPRPAPRPNPSPAPKPAPEPAAPAPTVTVRPQPLAPAPVVTEASAAPAAVQALTGVYRGRGAGDELLLELLFGPDGKLSGRTARGGKSADATGTWEQVGDLVSFVLLERSGEERMAYSGSVGSVGASGRMSAGGTNVGKFQVGR